MRDLTLACADKLLHGDQPLRFPDAYTLPSNPSTQPHHPMNGLRNQEDRKILLPLREFQCAVRPISGHDATAGIEIFWGTGRPA
ncbi:hypothetical protein NOCARDAX2BIS_80049 [Nocardioides sp. AX2bis]|nr:hypothetical protein NOCARDAX2BIS_80049 [Nocardioides sp. AX2bis]